MAKIRKGSHCSSQTGGCSSKDRCELPLPSVLISYILLINPKILICPTFLKKITEKCTDFPKIIKTYSYTESSVESVLLNEDNSPVNF